MRRGAFPTADTLARAMILAAAELGELDALRRFPTALMAGRLEIRARWHLQAALYAAWPQHRLSTTSAWCGISPPANYATLGWMSRQSFWREDLVDRLFLLLVEADR